MKTVMIDVREKDEFDAEHIEGSILIPLSNFEKLAPTALDPHKDNTIIVMCRSGKRAALAATAAAKIFGGINCQVYEGGILEWKKQGKPTVATKKFHLPILRQTQLAIGILVLSGSLLSYFIHPNFVFLTGFAGAGLILAGTTGFCGMAELISRMPWNKSNPKKCEELHTASPSSKSCSS